MRAYACSSVLYLFSPLQERGAGRLCVNGLERSDERELAFRNVPQAPSSAREHTTHRATQIRAWELKDMGITDYIGEQFKRPRGFGGKVATHVMNIQNRGLYDATERALALEDGERALEAGFGNGVFMQRLSRKRNCDYYGIDASPDMVSAASRRNPNARLSLGDIMRTSYVDGFFDKVFTINTVYFWPGLAPTLAEINRILKDGGVFVNTLYTKEFLDKLPVAGKGYSKYSAGELARAGEHCGFKVEAESAAGGKALCLTYQKTGM